MPSNRVCARTILELPWLLNGSLPVERRREVREHLISCPACRQELARTREMLAMVTVQEGTAAAGTRGNVVRFRASSAPVGRRSPWIAAAAAIAIAVLGGLFSARRADQAPIAGTSTAQTAVAVVADDADLLFRDGFDAGKLDGWKQNL